MIKVIIENSVPYLKGIAERYVSPIYLDNDDIIPENINEAEAMIVRSITKCNASLLRGTPIKYIVTATAGTDHIDSTYCTENAIAWDSTPGCNAIAVAQYVFSTLSLLSIKHGFSLLGRTIGIIGVGHVGREVERISKALGIRTLLYDPPREAQEGSDLFVPLSRIQEEADIITLHVPLTDTTKYMVNDEFLVQCKRSPILINACRGLVCSSTALIRAKQKGLISHLIIDCWEGEPNINQDLLNNVDIASPHIAGFSADGKHRGARMALKALCEHFDIPYNNSLLEPRELLSPQQPIDLSLFPLEEAIQNAFLATFDPRSIDMAMRGRVFNFESLRKHYHYPREMSAHQVIGGSVQERSILSEIGFRLIEV